MSIALNVVGGVIAGIFAIAIYEWIRRPRLSITILSQKSLAGRNDSWVATQHVRVLNREPPRLLRKFLRRSDAHSCYAWVMLVEPQPSGTAGTGASYWRANWEVLYRHPSLSLSEREILVASPERIAEFIDISSGGAADIAIVEKATGQSTCLVVPWGEELQIGEYVVKVEVGCSGLPHVSKWFLLENKAGTADAQGLLDSFVLRELTGKELRQYLKQ